MISVQTNKTKCTDKQDAPVPGGALGAAEGHILIVKGGYRVDL